MDNNQYINIDSVKNEEEFVEENIDQSGVGVYQPQQYTDLLNNKMILKHVGTFVKICDVLINKFNLTDNIECVITNSIYTENELDNILTKKVFNIFKIFVNYLNGNSKSEIGIMMTNFNIEKILDGNIFEGKYVVVFACDNKHVVLDETNHYVSNNYYIECMITSLVDEHINNIIMEKINK